ncbi:MAG: hypothetical protein AW09_001948 [Candidatus Accumulibacter phosphatis]|uniref:Uncharacterized protein n=1 Tax=Candidatus Accumulibacter phosphatis TaxID=327160 RepID=A0A080LY75_9PROT|nr:MAG: hypothetical protein AW09_001948 [Candidatus Accumulibacter phosphatis]
MHHLLGFVKAQQAVIDEDAGQLVADCAVNQCRSDRGIDTARKTENHLFGAHLRTNLVDCLGDVIGHVPVISTTADVAHEAADDFLALEGMRDFRMKLHCVESAFFVGHCRDRRRFVAADDLEARRQFGDLVTMAHPDVEECVALGIAAILNALEQRAVAACAHFGIAEFASAGTLDLAAQLLGHALHAVADAQHGYAKLEHQRRDLEVRHFVDRIRPSGENDSLWSEVANELCRDVVGMQLAIHLLLADAASNQLGDLRAKVENQNFLMGHDDASNDAGGLPPPADHRLLLNRRGSSELPW